MKKAIVVAGLLVLALLICGCTTTSRETPPPIPEVPSIIGNWTGPMYGYVEGSGYTTWISAIPIRSQ